MAELTEILQKEKIQREAVETAKKDAQTELEKKKQVFASELDMAGITKQQEDKVLEYKAQQMKQIKKTIEENFKTRLQELQSKEQANSAKAVTYVVKSLFIE